MFVSGPERVLGVDPGLSRCGYGVVETCDGVTRAGAAGVVETPPSAPVPERLLHLADELDRVVAELRPTAVAVERVLFQANARTAMSVGQASGLALVAAARHGLPVAQYSPNEVKQAVAGYGGAGKAQVGAMVKALLRLDAVPEPPDVADALALALCHLAFGRSGRPATERGPVAGLQAAISAAVARDAAGGRRR